MGVSQDREEMDELVREFLLESHENLDRLDQELLALERRPDDSRAIASIFRTIHTIKGTCGFLGFSKLESVAHAGESLLARMRDGELHLTRDIATVLLQMVDAIRSMLAAIESSGREGDGDYAGLVAELHRLQASEHTEPPGLPADACAAAGPDVHTTSPTGPPITAPLPPVASPSSAMEPENRDPRARVVSAASAVEAVAAEPPEQRALVSDAHVRVPVGLLDKLMNLVGELVLARNQILQFVPEVDDQLFTSTTQRLNLITTELQSGVMKTRMQPIGNVWDKLPRVVRDLSLSLGKQIRVEMEGRETELDKTIIEAIKDPITHLVRNCVDHGVEAPEDRLTCGKSAEGRLFLRAFHEGGQVNIEISDDGAGLDVDRIRAKGVERGLISPEQAARMSDRELQNLIFLPGFSTAKRVSNVSGRGVGMDVVKTNIEKIGGVVDLVSRQGAGTTFRIKIPLTLAIIPALVVSTGGERFAIPQISLLELVRLEGDQARTRIEVVHGAPVYRLRGTLLPLVYLGRELGLASAGKETNDVVNIVVLQADERRFGLVVDHINDTEEIVVKPLGKDLKSITAFAGATIMGDGRVALILDVLGLAQRANVVGQVHERTRITHAASTDAAETERRTLLLFALDDDRRMAIPLSMVSRLEVFSSSAVETLGRERVVQYRGDVLPLVPVAELLGSGSAWAPKSSESVHVVVHRDGDRSVGIVVDRVIDIVHEVIEIKRSGDREPRSSAVVGCAVIHKRVTELLDLAAVFDGGHARGNAFADAE